MVSILLTRQSKIVEVAVEQLSYIPPLPDVKFVASNYCIERFLFAVIVSLQASIRC
jgi:hypothetical protein